MNLEQYKWHVFEEKYLVYKTESKNICFYRFTQEFLPGFVSLLKQFTENFFIPIQVLICFVF